MCHAKLINGILFALLFFLITNLQDWTHGGKWGVGGFGSSSL